MAAGRRQGAAAGGREAGWRKSRSEEQGRHSAAAAAPPPQPPSTFLSFSLSFFFSLERRERTARCQRRREAKVKRRGGARASERIGRGVRACVRSFGCCLVPARSSAVEVVVLGCARACLCVGGVCWNAPRSCGTVHVKQLRHASSSAVCSDVRGFCAGDVSVYVRVPVTRPKKTSVAAVLRSPRGFKSRKGSKMRRMRRSVDLQPGERRALPPRRRPRHGGSTRDQPGKKEGEGGTSIFSNTSKIRRELGIGVWGERRVTFQIPSHNAKGAVRM